MRISLRLKRWVSRTKYEEMAFARQHAEDNNRWLQSQIELLLAERDAARQDASRSKEMVADWMAEQMFGKPIYNSGAPRLPEKNSSLVEQPQSNRITARQVVRQAESDFLKQLAELDKSYRTSDDLSLSATT